MLSNTANTYAGGTTIGGTPLTPASPVATLAIAGPGSLGTGGLTFGAKIGATTLNGGRLRFDYTGTFSANVNNAFSTVANPSILDTNGNNVTLSGIVSGNGAA